MEEFTILDRVTGETSNEEMTVNKGVKVVSGCESYSSVGEAHSRQREE